MVTSNVIQLTLFFRISSNKAQAFISFPVSKTQHLNEGGFSQDQTFISNISVLFPVFILTCVCLLIVMMSVDILD